MGRLEGNDPRGLGQAETVLGCRTKHWATPDELHGVDRVGQLATAVETNLIGLLAGVLAHRERTGNVAVAAAEDRVVDIACKCH